MKHKAFKRFTSGLLAALLVAVYPSSVIVSMAASQYYIKFDAADPLASTIIEGSTISVIGSLPDGHVFQAPPFDIRINGVKVEQDLFNIRDGTSKNRYDVRTMRGAAFGTKGNNPTEGPGDEYTYPGIDPRNVSLRTYSMDASLSATVSAGGGLAELKADPIAGGVDKTVVFTVTNKVPIPVTSKSELTFVATSGEPDQSGLVFSSVRTIKDTNGNQISPSGTFLDLADKPVSTTTPSVVGGKTTFTVSIGRHTFVIVMSGADPILKDSVFTIEYDLQALEPLLLRVATPQKAVNDVRDSIEDDPDDPKATDGKHAYIQLAKGDNLASITSGFSLLSKIQKYNNTLNIEWEWVCPASPNTIRIENKGQTTTQASLSIAENDVKGVLRAVVQYTLTNPYSVPPGVSGVKEVTEVRSEICDIAVTVLGTGKLPNIVPIDKTIGQNPPIAILDKVMPSTMDVYTGDVATTIYPFVPIHPYKTTATLTLGEGRGRADEVAIRYNGTPAGTVNLYIENSTNAYVYGTKIKNPSLITGQLAMDFVAQAAGHTELIFDFYYKGVKADRSLTVPITVVDNTPSDFRQLSKLELKSDELEKEGEKLPDVKAEYPGGVVDFGFKSTTYTYGTINLPNKAATINIIPDILRTAGMPLTVDYTISGGNMGGIAPAGTLDLKATDIADRAIMNLPLFVGPPRAVTLTVKAQNGKPQVYVFSLNRLSQNTDSSLKSLSVTDPARTEYLDKFLPGTFSYAFEVPYKTHWLKLVGKTANPWATQIFVPTLVTSPDGSPEDKSWLKVTHPDDPAFGFGGPKTTNVTVEVTAEDTTAKKTLYSLNISRKDPSTNALVGVLEVQNASGKPLPFDGNVIFNKDTKQYELHIPYSATKLRMLVKPEDLLAEKATVQVDTNPAETKDYAAKGEAIRFDLETLPPPTTQKFPITVTATAESGKITDPPYIINVIRNDPDRDSALTNLVIKDQEGNDITTFAFNPEKPDYDISVPFKVEKAQIIPTARSPLAEIKLIDGNNVVILSDVKLSETYELRAGQSKDIRLEIRPEDKSITEPRTYTIRITRQLASNDARLKSLVANGGEPIKPTFDPDKERYTVNMAGGTGLTLTAVPVIEYSTIMINGERAESGQPSKPIELLTGKTNIVIEVTAEDGRTTKKYYVEVTDLSKIPKGNNADLSGINVSYGRLDPSFRPGIVEYDVAVLPEVSSIEIIPTTADPKATFEVFEGTKKLGDYSNKYTTIIRDGATTITIKVTAENGTVKKDYVMTVYRKDDEKQGLFKPITSEMVDFTQAANPIVVDISKYAVVTAELFNTLKTKYPEKTILFQGNDYSLQITGKDIVKLVPHDQLFDLSISFTAPDEEAIWNVISEEPRNDKVDPVFVHFNHHGVLPGPMLFTISLGRQYRNESTTWNYYNEERDRIDFYGGVRTNSRGTFTVKLEHMSTYLLSKYRIVNAENKVGADGGIGGIVGYPGTPGKPNPNTGGGSEVGE